MYSKKYLNALSSKFANFASHVWLHIELPPLTDVQLDICDYLQYGPKRLQIQAFRGIGKSYLLAAFACWELWNDKEKSILIISAGSARADSFALFMRNMIKNIDILKHMEPDKSIGERATQSIFDVHGCRPKGSPSVMSAGITSQITGLRADRILCDDVEVVANSATNDLREKLLRLISETDAILKPNGRTIVLGTFQCEMSLYNSLYDKGYDMRIIPARIPTEEQANAYGAKLSPMIRNLMVTGIAGTTTDPKRFSDIDLAERELSYGKSGFALQFLLDTSLSDANKFPLKIDDLIINHVGMTLPSEIHWSNSPLLKMKDMPNVGMAKQNYYSPESVSQTFLAPEMRVLSVDPSGRGGDETGYAVGFMLHGNIFIPEAGGLLGGYSDTTLIELCEIAKKYKVNQIVIESNFGDSMYTQLLKPHLGRIYPCSVEDVRHHTQKETRIIDTLEPLLNQHRLIVDPRVIQKDYDSAIKNYTAETSTQYMLFYQMSRLSKEKGSLRHDDRLDALAMMCKYFLDILDVDQGLRASQAKEELLDRSLDQFKEEWYEKNGGNNNQGLKLWGR